MMDKNKAGSEAKADGAKGANWDFPNGAQETAKAPQNGLEAAGQGKATPEAEKPQEDGKAAAQGPETAASAPAIIGLGDYSFFNGTSSEIHIHHAHGVIDIKPMQRRTVARDIAEPWLKTQVGKAYVEGGLLKSKEITDANELDFSSHSDLTPPKELLEPAQAGNFVSTVEKREAQAGTIK